MRKPTWFSWLMPNSDHQIQFPLSFSLIDQSNTGLAAKVLCHKDDKMSSLFHCTATLPKDFLSISSKFSISLHVLIDCGAGISVSSLIWWTFLE